jgi:hypothetical protein
MILTFYKLINYEWTRIIAILKSRGTHNENINSVKIRVNLWLLSNI